MLQAQLLCQVDLNTLEWVLNRNLELDLDRDLVVLVIGRLDFLGLLIQDEGKVARLSKLKLGHLDLFDLVLHDGWADDLLDVGLGHLQNLLVTVLIEAACKGWEALHKVDERVQCHHDGVVFVAKLTVFGLELRKVSVTLLSHTFLDDRQVRY